MSEMSDDDLWNAMPVAAVLVDAGDRIVRMNPAAEVLLNVSAKSLAGQDFSTKIQVNTDISAALTGARAGHGMLVLHDVNIASARRADVNCAMQISPIAEGFGRVMILMQPRHIASQLDQALQADSAHKTAIGLSDMLAHEIKNPLAGITGAAQLLAMNLTGDDLEMTDLIVQESHRILGLLQQVEQFGDLRPPKLEPLNIHDLLETARKSAAVGVAADMAFQDSYDPSLPAINGDAELLLQVFSNLFKNAAQAAEKSGVIRIKTFFEVGLRLHRADGPGTAVPLQVEISDNGPGIAPAVAQRLFEPFITGRESGTGLGLALVSKIVAQHRGSIGVNAKDGWTTFKISLPVGESQKGII